MYRVVVDLNAFDGVFAYLARADRFIKTDGGSNWWL